jgi:hypothetical protein
MVRSASTTSTLQRHLLRPQSFLLGLGLGLGPGPGPGRKPIAGAPVEVRGTVIDLLADSRVANGRIFPIPIPGEQVLAAGQTLFVSTPNQMQPVPYPTPKESQNHA